MSHERLNVLIVDDEPHILREYQQKIENLGHKVSTADSGRLACELNQQNSYNAVLLDITMPGIDGIETGKKLREINPNIYMIALSAFNNRLDINRAIEAEFDDYLVKEVPERQLIIALLRARRFCEKAQEAKELREKAEELQKKLDHAELLQTTFGLPPIDQLPSKPPVEGMCGTSLPMRAVYYQIGIESRNNDPIYICGETGVGKDVVARAIHHLGRSRQGGEFIKVNCPFLNKDRTYIELFGCRRRYPGYQNDQRVMGAVEKAEGGTLFLDEVKDLSLEVQADLFHFLDNGEYTPLGEKTRRANVRIIAATNHDLKHAIEKGEFREELFYRLKAEVPINVPPLRKRVGDIPLLIKYFLRKEAEAEKYLEAIGEAMRQVEYSWPGNVRELETFIEYLVRYKITDAAAVAQMLRLRGLRSHNSNMNCITQQNIQPNVLIMATDIKKVDRRTVEKNIEWCFKFLEQHGRPPRYIKDIEEFIVQQSGIDHGVSRPRQFGQHLFDNAEDWVRIIRDNREYLRPIIPILAKSRPIERGLKVNGLL